MFVVFVGIGGRSVGPDPGEEDRGSLLLPCRCSLAASSSAAAVAVGSSGSGSSPFFLLPLSLPPLSLFPFPFSSPRGKHLHLQPTAPVPPPLVVAAQLAPRVQERECRVGAVRGPERELRPRAGGPPDELRRPRDDPVKSQGRGELDALRGLEPGDQGLQGRSRRVGRGRGELCSLPPQPCCFFLLSSVSVVAAVVFAILDVLSPSVGLPARQGAGFGLGANLVGFPGAPHG